MNKTQVKTALIPHNNDQIEIKNLQNKLPGIHFTPLYFFCDEEFKTVPSKITLQKDYTLINGIWHLAIKAQFESEEKTLFLPFIKSAETLEDHNLKLNLKVFQIAQIQVTQTGPVTEYTILESKWCKLR